MKAEGGKEETSIDQPPTAAQVVAQSLNYQREPSEDLNTWTTGCEGGERDEDAEGGDQEDEAAEEGGALQEEAVALSALT